MNLRDAIAALLPLTFIAVPLASAPAAQEQPAAGMRWVADWGARRCTLARTAANATPVLALRLLPGGARIELIFPDRPPPAAELEGAAAALLFSDGTHGDVRLWRRSPAEGAPSLSAGGEAVLLDQFARSSSVKLVHGGDTLADVRLPGARAAIAALRRCADSALSEWGVDVAAQAALRRRPERSPKDAAWLHAADYPTAALRRGSAGEVVVRLAVEPSGRVRQCTVVASSGDADLDATTCRLFSMRGRYVPALDAEGRPVAAAAIEVVRWTLPT